MTERRLKFYFVTSLTLGRIPLILIFFAVNIFLLRADPHTGAWYLGKPETHAYWFAIAFSAMSFSALTDLFDGYFARRFKVESKLGAHADPLTDKIFYLTTLSTLVWLAALTEENTFHSSLLLALTIILLMRDHWVSFLRSIGSIYNADVKANWSGKARTIICFPVICAIYWYLLAPRAPWPHGSWIPLHRLPWLIYTLEAISILITLLTIWIYSVHYWPWIKREIRGVNEEK